MDNNELGMRLPLCFIIIIEANITLIKKIRNQIIIINIFRLTDGRIDASDQTASPKPGGHLEEALPLTAWQITALLDVWKYWPYCT